MLERDPCAFCYVVHPHLFVEPNTGKFREHGKCVTRDGYRSIWPDWFFYEWERLTIRNDLGVEEIKRRKELLILEWNRRRAKELNV